MILHVENGIKAAIRTALGQTVKAVETHPGNWSKETIKHMLTTAPCVYVGFTMGTRQNDNELKGIWHVYLVARALQGNKEVGIYNMTEQLLVALHGLDLDQADALQFKQVKNLFSFAEAQRGVCCYEMTFELLMNWPDHVDESALDAFERFHGDAVDQAGKTLISTDTELEQ